jgi:AraC-like DNA-binding protein
MSPPPQTGWVTRFSSVRTSDLDLARLAINTYFYGHRLDLLNPSAQLASSFELLRFGPVALGDMAYGADVRLDFGELGAYHVDLPRSGHLAVRQGGRQFVGTAGKAAVFQPVGDTVIDQCSGDCRLLALKIERVALESHLEALLDAPTSSPLRLAPNLDVTREPGRSWARLVELLGEEITNRSGLIYQPLVAEWLCESLMTGLLLATDHPYRDALARPSRSPAPGAVKRVVDAIQAHPEAAFTTRKFAEIAGVSVRSMQEGFRRYVDVSPMAYLRSVRLARVHEELRRADPRTVTVAEVAHRWGFLHLGRFAAAYRARFGTSPSQVLRGDG